MNERHVRLTFILLLLAHLAFLSWQVRSSGREPGLLDRWVFQVVAPVAAAMERVGRGVSGFGRYFETRGRLQRENRALRQELLAMRAELVRLRGVEEEAQRLTESMAFVSRWREPVQVADVIFIDPRSNLRSLVIRSNGRIEVDQPVVTADGIVGRVIGTSARNYALVQLITDRSTGVAAMIERTRRQGVALGTGSPMLELAYVSAQADVRIGDRVLTSGADGVFPGKLSVGTVVSVEPGEELFSRIKLRAAVELRELEHVFVLPREAVPEQWEGEDARP